MRISTESTTNFEASGSTELIRSPHNVRDQWLLMQGTKVQNKCARKKVSKNCSRCISRNQRDTLRTSWNVVCKLVVIRFVQSVNSKLCTVSRGFKLGIVYQFPAKTTTSQHHPAVPQNDTNVLLFHTQRDSCLSASASKPDFLSFRPRQEDEERARAS